MGEESEFNAVFDSVQDVLSAVAESMSIPTDEWPRAWHVSAWGRTVYLRAVQPRKGAKRLRVLRDALRVATAVLRDGGPKLRWIVVLYKPPVSERYMAGRTAEMVGLHGWPEVDE